MKKFHLSLFLVLSLIGLFAIGCEVQTAVAPRAGVSADPVQDFPLHGTEEGPAVLRFVNNRIFLWREDQTAEEMSQVLAIDTWMDEEDIKAGELNSKLAKLEEKLAPVDQLLRKKNTELIILVNTVKKNTQEVVKLGVSLASLNQKLTEATEKKPQDNATVDGLRAQIKTAEEKKQALQKAIVQADKDRTQLEADLKDLKTKNTELAEREKLIKDRSVQESVGRDKTAEIADLVDWCDSPPTSVFFSIDKMGKLDATIEGWVLEKGGETRDFTSDPSGKLAALAGGSVNNESLESSDPEGSVPVEAIKKPTIVNLKYIEQGGVFLFDVLVYGDEAQTRLVDTYSFRLARLKYNSVDGRIYLAGKFTRTRNLSSGQVEVRDGFAKFVDKNN